MAICIHGLFIYAEQRAEIKMWVYFILLCCACNVVVKKLCTNHALKYSCPCIHVHSYVATLDS